jgi:hypothetical protein
MGTEFKGDPHLARLIPVCRLSIAPIEYRRCRYLAPEENDGGSTEAAA